MEKFQKTPRKKLWEIRDLYHCSVAGTCLSLEETKKIFRKTGIIFPGPVRDYEIHGAAVNICASKSDASKMMNSFIETKYSFFVSLFNKAENEAEIMKLWDEFHRQGNAAGAYWALMTHPSVSHRNLDRAFGDMHILSHLNGSDSRAGIREIDELKRKNTALLKSNEEYKQRNYEIKQNRKADIENIKQIANLRKELSAAENKIRIFKDGDEIRSLKDEINRLTTKCSDLTLSNGKLAEIEKNANETISVLINENSILREESAGKDDELAALENSLIPLLQNNAGLCGGCSTDDTRRINLCGKCILYVGGKPSVVNRCREMVELCGGRFIHHDGGKEENLSRLPAILHRADIVFCPLDCISHNACLSVKKMSLRQSKPFMFLKSSGFSTFIKGVDDISKTEPHIPDSETLQN